MTDSISSPLQEHLLETRPVETLRKELQEHAL